MVTLPDSQAPLAQAQPLRIGGWSWLAVRGWGTALQAAGTIPWLDLGSMPGCHLLKLGAGRSVWRVPLGEGVVIAKVHAAPRGWARLKTRLLGPSARREFAVAVHALRSELPVVRPVAWGALDGAHRFGPQVLLTEEVCGGRPLSDYWLENAEAGGRRNRDADNRLIHALAAFLAQIHQGMLVPTDLHPGNILVRQVDGRPRPVLVDLHNAAPNVAVREPARVRNLVELNQWFQHHASRQDRLRFLLAYLLTCYEQPSAKLVRWYVREVSDVTSYLRGRLEKKRDKRIFQDNRYFGTLALPGGWDAFVFLQAKRPVAHSACSHLVLSRSDWNAALPGLTATAEQPPADLSLSGRRIAVSVERRLGGGAELRRQWEDSFKRIHRHHTAALPLALLERRVNGRVQERILVIEKGANYRNEQHATANGSATGRHHRL